MLGVVFAVSFAAERGTDVARWLCERKWLVQFLILFAALLTVVLFVYGNAAIRPLLMSMKMSEVILLAW